MSFDHETVKKVARLARIKIEESELPGTADRFGKIMKFVEQLDEVDTDDVAPMTSFAPIHTHMRADEVNDGDQQQAVLQNGPETAHGFYVVPKVVE